MLHTPEFISKLKRNEAFVFCSNTNGEHYGGAVGWSVNEIKSIFWKAVKRRTKVKLYLIINYSEGLYKVAYNVYKRIKQH